MRYVIGVMRPGSCLLRFVCFPWSRASSGPDTPSAPGPPSCALWGACFLMQRNAFNEYEDIKSGSISEPPELLQRRERNPCSRA